MNTTTRALTVAFVVKLIAKEEKADEVGSFLAGAVSLANKEAGTVVWFALRTFASQADRQLHIEGPIAAALMANAERLLAAPPEILPAEVLAAKIPDGR